MTNPLKGPETLSPEARVELVEKAMSHPTDNGMIVEKSAILSYSARLTGAVEALTNGQRQLDQDGVFVGVSREALDMALAALAPLLAGSVVDGGGNP